MSAVPSTAESERVYLHSPGWVGAVNVLGYKLLVSGKIGCIKEANIPGYRPRYSGALYNCAGIIAGDAII